MKVDPTPRRSKFIALRVAVNAIAMRLVIPAEQIDARMGSYSGLVKTGIRMPERMIIQSQLKTSRAAGLLLDLLNRPAGSRPSWYENSKGYALLAEDVWREGMGMLAALASQDGTTKEVDPSAEQSGDEIRRGLRLGFDASELASFLTASGIPHSLEAQQPLLGDSGPPAKKNSPTISGSGPAPAAVRKYNFRGAIAEALHVAVECRLSRNTEQVSGSLIT
jgi:hypothetical protein